MDETGKKDELDETIALGKIAEWSPYRKQLEKTITIPNSNGVTMVIQKIGKRGLEEAAFVLQKEAIQKMQDLGGAEMFASMRTMTGQKVNTQKEAEDIAQKAVEKDPLLAYDHATLIRLGTKIGPKEFGLVGADIKDLDPTFAEWLPRQIYEFEIEDAPKKS